MILTLVALCTDGTTDLFASTLDNIGSVRVCVNGTWRKVCGIGNTVLNDDLASVACSSAGFSKYGNKTVYLVGDILKATDANV